MKTAVSTMVALAMAAVCLPMMTSAAVLTVGKQVRPLLANPTNLKDRHLPFAAGDAQNSVTVSPQVASNLYKNANKEPEEETCQYQRHVSPDTFLTILFGVGAIVEPLFLALFVHRTHNLIVQQLQLRREDTFIGTLGERKIEMHQVPAAVTTRGTDVDTGRLPEHQPDEDLSAGATAPPYSLTDMAPGRRCDVW